jgi:hypothetical protein
VFPVREYGYPMYLYAKETMAAPETALRVLVEKPEEVVCGVVFREAGVPEWGVPEGEAASVLATGIAPKPVLAARLRARSGFLIRDLQIFWSH